MPLNTNPIFSGKPDVKWNTVNITTANTAVDGTGTVGTNIFLIFTANATNGGFVKGLRVIARGTNVATVMRFFINNGSSNATPANNSLIGEITCPATTTIQTASLAPLFFPINEALPAGYTIYATIGTTVVSGFSVTAFGGDYTP